MALRKGKIVEAAGVQRSGGAGEKEEGRSIREKQQKFSSAPLHPCTPAILTPPTLQLNLVPFGIESNFPATYRTRETADLFLLLIMHLLEDGGRGAIVLPDGTLFGEGVKTRIKEKLLDECNLHTIVRLPNGVFSPYTGIKTNLLFFTKGESTQEIWYYEHPYPPGYKSYSKTKPIRIEEFEPEKAWWYNRDENEFAWRVYAQDIKDNGYNLDIKNPHKIDAEHADLDDMLADYQILLADLGKTRNALKQELMAALGGESA